MTDGEVTIDDALLHAFADGQATPAERREVERYLAAHPDKAAEIGNWQRQNEAIRTLYGQTGEVPVPARLEPHWIAATRADNGLRWPQLAAAAMVLLMLGSGLGWAGRGLIEPEESASDLLISSALTAHALYVKESRRAVEVSASEGPSLFTWLSNRLDRQIAGPDLTGQGFTLVGGRLLPPDPYAGAGPAALLMYQNATADRVTVYITASLASPGERYAVAETAGLEAHYWADDRITCTVVGDLPEAEMQRVAKSVYQQLTWRPDTEEG